MHSYQFNKAKIQVVQPLKNAHCQVGPLLSTKQANLTSNNYTGIKMLALASFINMFRTGKQC